MAADDAENSGSAKYACACICVYAVGHHLSFCFKVLLKKRGALSSSIEHTIGSLNQVHTMKKYSEGSLKAPKMATLTATIAATA